MNRRGPANRLPPGAMESISGPTPSKRDRSDRDLENGNTPPSTVVFVRNLPLDVLERELTDLAMPFGVITSIILTRKSGVALIDMSNKEAAIEMVDYYSSIHIPRIRGSGPLEVTFSKFPTLTTTGMNPKIAEAILLANKQFMTGTVQGFSALSSTVLHVQLEHPSSHIQYGYRPFYQIFSHLGRVLRIVTFRTGSGPKAFVEFENPIHAHVAKVRLNGTPLLPREFPDSSIMSIEFSRQETVEVRQEDATSRDFVRNPITEYDMADDRRPSGSRPNSHFRPPMKPVMPEPSNLLDQLNEDLFNMLDPMLLSKLAGRIIKPLLKAALHVGGSQANFLKAQADVLEELVGGLPTYPAPQMFMTPHVPDHVPREEPIQFGGNSPVVYVSNLDLERATPDILFILFGVYGDVQRIKILHQKRDTALIQMSDPEQASLAVAHLEGAPLFGKKLRCMLSKNTSVTLHPPGKDEAPEGQPSTTNRDYSFHHLHRFRKPGARNLQYVTKPTKFLHIGNLPSEISDEDIHDMFQTVLGFKLLNLKMLTGKKPMALVELQSTEKAIESLVMLHDYEISCGNRIRVSFTKSII